VLGSFARRIKGLSSEDSFDTLKLLQSYVTRPENTVRWRWQVGISLFGIIVLPSITRLRTMAICPRRVQRITIVGDVPVSIDGQRGSVVTGDVSDYIPVSQKKDSA
jgi:taurine dioxygenase